MHRLVLFVALAIGFSTLSASAAPHRKHKIVATPATGTQPAVANRPSWAGPHQCFTNDGNGRYLPCDLGDGR